MVFHTLRLRHGRVAFQKGGEFDHKASRGLPLFRIFSVRAFFRLAVVFGSHRNSVILRGWMENAGAALLLLCHPERSESASAVEGPRTAWYQRGLGGWPCQKAGGTRMRRGKREQGVVPRWSRSFDCARGLAALRMTEQKESKPAFSIHPLSTVERPSTAGGNAAIASGAALGSALGCRRPEGPSTALRMTESRERQTTTGKRKTF